MPHQTEPSANTALGSLLQHRLPGSQVWPENTQVIAGRAGQQPDILITTPGHAPVVVEAEYLPAYSGRGRRQETPSACPPPWTPAPWRPSSPCRYPEAVSRADDLPATLREAGLSYCILTEGDAEQPRAPLPRLRLAGRLG